MSAEPRVTAPEHIEAHYESTAFDCGQPELNEWLRLQALDNEASGASRPYVVRAEGRVVGYYALATGAITSSGDCLTGMSRPMWPIRKI